MTLKVQDFKKNQIDKLYFSDIRTSVLSKTLLI